MKINTYLKLHAVRKLQIGTGQNSQPGWLNTDRDTGLSQGSVYLDAAKKIPFDSLTFDYVYFEHLIEHLDFIHGERLIQECYRVLKPGGKIRISTPDLNFLIELYVGTKTVLEKKYIKWLLKNHTDFNIFLDTFVINTYFRDWGHKFIYDYKTLKEVLNRQGFMNINKVPVGESSDKNLENLESHGLIVSEEFNRLESLVMEATKPILDPA